MRELRTKIQAGAEAMIEKRKIAAIDKIRTIFSVIEVSEDIEIRVVLADNVGRIMLRVDGDFDVCVPTFGGTVYLAKLCDDCGSIICGTTPIYPREQGIYAAFNSGFYKCECKQESIDEMVRDIVTEMLEEV